MADTRTIITVKITKGCDDILINELMRSFSGDDGESPCSVSFYGEHTTPTPVLKSPQILRITTGRDLAPKDLERGFVFGRNPHLCDILLDDFSVSEEQFANYSALVATWYYAVEESLCLGYLCRIPPVE
jgi:hypothetical protein